MKASGSIHSDAGSGAPTEPAKEPHEGEGSGEDELAKIEAALAKSKKAVAAANAESGDEETAIAKRPAASAKATAKRPAASAKAIAKRPAAAVVPGKFNIELWAAENLDKEEAAREPIRSYFISRLHHRAYKAAKSAGMSEKAACEARTLIRGKAGIFYDSFHKKAESALGCISPRLHQPHPM